MPKELNIEKLERKFMSLTKSRESIQAVSFWIMHHYEFCEEIVNQWYVALTKDRNALMMFYVANEVIQNCGKKRVPQYREAFSKVLEKAVSLEKVKEIKSDVIRIFTLWKERSIFDNEFYQRLESKLNGSEVNSSPFVEDEPSELEIITKYKSGNLFDSLKRLKTKEMESKAKEEMLNYANEPQSFELNNLTERSECLEMLKKIDSFYNLIEDCLKATNHEVAARKDAMKELKYSCIFYTAQYGDVKKVANAYLAYGRKLKNMERKLSERMLILPSPVENNSPCFSESNLHASPIECSPLDPDTSSVSRTSSRMSPMVSNEKSLDSEFSSENLKSSTSFWSKISKKASSDFPKNSEKETEETMQKRSELSPKLKFSKLTELFAKTKPDFEKEIKPESDTLESLSGITSIKCLSSPNQPNENTVDVQTDLDQKIDLRENVENSTGLPLNQESKEIIGNLSKEASCEEKNTSSTQDSNEIDLLLEESYDTKKAKSNVSVKRKIELLLQSKNKKVCTDGFKEENSDNILESNTSSEDLVLERKKYMEDTINKDNKNLNNVCNSAVTERENITCEDSKTMVPMLSENLKNLEKIPSDVVLVKENENIDIKKNLSLEEKIQNVSNILMPSLNAIEQCKDINFLSEQNDINEKEFSDTISVTENGNFNIKKNLSLEEKIQNVSNILVSSSYTIEQSKNLDLSEQSSTQDSLSNKHKFSEHNIKTDSSIISGSNLDSESSKVFESDSIFVDTPSTFLDSSLYSSISSLSTEFLKNILEKNKNSPSKNVENSSPTDTVKDSTESAKLLENQGSENIVTIPASKSVKDLVSSSIETEPLSQMECIENVVENKINVKGKTDIKIDNSSDNNSMKFNELEISNNNEQKITDSIVSKREETVLCTKNKKVCSSNSDTQSKTGYQKDIIIVNDKKNQLKIKNADNKPNLLLTLQNILGCISNKNLSVCDSKNVGEATPMSLENCLTLYHALKSADTKHTNDASSLSSQNGIVSKPPSESTITSGVYSKDNLEVIDMECDSE